MNPGNIDYSQGLLNLQFLPLETIRTENLILRRVLKTDAEEILFLRSDPRVMRHIAKKKAHSIEDALKFIQVIDDLLEKNEGVTWGITLAGGNDKIIGTTGLWRIVKDHHRAEIGYALHPDHWNKGINTEAMKAVLEYGFKTIKLHTIEANLDPDNIGSRRTLEKSGFVKEGHLKENYFFEGKYTDTLIYSIKNPY